MEQDCRSAATEMSIPCFKPGHWLSPNTRFSFRYTLLAIMYSYILV